MISLFNILSFSFLRLAGRGLNLRPFLETIAPIYMPTLNTTHPRIADLGKPHIFIIGGDTDGIGVCKAPKVSKTQTVRAYQYTYRYLQPNLYLAPASGSKSNAIACSLYKNFDTLKDFFYHFEEATPRLVKGITDKAARRAWRYIRQTGVHVYLIVNVISGKTRKSSRYTDHGQVATTRLNRVMTDTDALKLHNLTTWLVWMFTLLISIIGFQTNSLSWRAGRMSSFSHDKSNRLIIARLKDCAQ